MRTGIMQGAPLSGNGRPAPGAPATPAQGGHGGGQRRHLVTLAVAVTLALLTLPAFGDSPGNTLDASWVAALHVAAHRRLQFGSEIVFTYGPLGFLTLPIPYFAATWGLSVVYIIVLRFTLCVALVAMLRRSMACLCRSWLRLSSPQPAGISGRRNWLWPCSLLPAFGCSPVTIRDRVDSSSAPSCSEERWPGCICLSSSIPASSWS